MRILFGGALALLLVAGVYGCNAPAEEMETVSLNISGMT